MGPCKQVELFACPYAFPFLLAFTHSHSFTLCSRIRAFPSFFFFPVLCPLLTSPLMAILRHSLAPPTSLHLWRPPGVSLLSFYSSRQIYPSLFRMTIGQRDLGAAYPDSQALYLVSVRRNEYLSLASFRFALADNTLAFNYKIPVITALSGLEN